MNWIDKLERRFGYLAISNLTYYLIGGQVITFILINANPAFRELLTFHGNLVMQGQYWRIVTFLFYPMSLSALWAVLAWYIYYMYGGALEREWGSFTYLVYILISLISTIVAGFIFPWIPLTNYYMFASIFLAFGYLFPNFTILLFFVIPIKVKWLALLLWLSILVSLVSGDNATRVIVLVSILNFIAFFGSDIWSIVWDRVRHSRRRALRTTVEYHKPYHVCAVCGKNEIDNPDMQIRYCSKCHPSTCYCGDHIADHSHVGSN